MVKLLNIKKKNNSKESITKSSFDLILDFERILKLSLPKNEERKTNCQHKTQNSPNKIILREQFYKIDEIYHEFLENISKIIKEELKEDIQTEIKEKIVETKPNSEEFLKITSLPIK